MVELLDAEQAPLGPKELGRGVRSPRSCARRTSSSRSPKSPKSPKFPKSRARASRALRSSGTVDEIAKCAAFVKTAHGGLTVSGGELMLQIRFLEALLRRCKEGFGLHTAIDTSGFLDLVDLFFSTSSQVTRTSTSWLQRRPRTRASLRRRLSEHGNQT